MSEKRRPPSGRSSGSRGSRQGAGNDIPEASSPSGRLLRSLLPSVAKQRRCLRHPTDRALGEFVAGRLTPPGRDVVRLHLARCRRCGEFVEDLRRLAAPITAADRLQPPPGEIRDLAFGAAVCDVAEAATKAFRAKRVRVIPQLSIVPDFFKKDLLESGLTPSLYLRRILEALGGMLPPGAEIRLGSEAPILGATRATT